MDFSGNVIRFADDFSEVYYNGLDKLDDGERLDKEVREDKEKEPKACPKCGYMPMGGKKCVGCGYEPPRPALVEHAPGEMQEIRLKGKHGAVLAPDAANMWAQLATYSKQHGKKPGWVWHKYIEIVGQEPPRGWRVESAPHVEPSDATKAKLRQMAIKFAKGRGRAAA